MPLWIRYILPSRNGWLVAAAVCIGVSLMIGYHQDQETAERAMLRKIGMSDQVLIQKFTPGRHENRIGQVSVLGEINADDSVRLNVGSETSPHWIRLTAVYAVGRDMLPFAEQFLFADRGEVRRPVHREAANGMARQKHVVDGIGDQALAFIVEEIGTGDTEAHAGKPGSHKIVAENESVSLIRLQGALVSGASIRAAASEALSAAGISMTPEILMIEPAPLAKDAADLEGRFDLLRWLAMITGMLIATATLAAPLIKVRIGARPRRPTGRVEVSATGSFPAIGTFQPIATQDELRMEDDIAFSQANGHDRVVRLGAAARCVAARLRSRR